MFCLIEYFPYISTSVFCNVKKTLFKDVYISGKINFKILLEQLSDIIML